MARVSFIDEQGRPDIAALADRLKRGRRGTLINLYRTLLHSPAVAEAWFDYSNAVRWKTDLDGRLRELVVVRIAHLYKAEYILRQHVPALTAAEGISDAECLALADWRPAPYFSDRERAALAYADAVSASGSAPDAVFADVAHHYNERQIVELTVLIGAFNMSARVMNASKSISSRWQRQVHPSERNRRKSIRSLQSPNRRFWWWRMTGSRA